MDRVIARRIVVRGEVQGVGFRWHCCRVADELGVAGWVTNRADGAVEIHAEGPPAAVGQLLNWCERGPRHAIVTKVEAAEAAPGGLTTFSVH